MNLGLNTACPEVHHGFRQYLQPNSEILPQLNHCRFLPNPFQFIIHFSNHSTVYNLSTDTSLNNPHGGSSSSSSSSEASGFEIVEECLVIANLRFSRCINYRLCEKCDSELVKEQHATDSAKRSQSHADICRRHSLFCEQPLHATLTSYVKSHSLLSEPH
jgi:hypothetical protein